MKRIGKKIKHSVGKRIAGGKNVLKNIKRVGHSMKRIHRTKIFHISRLKLGKFKPKIKMQIEKGNFVIKTVEDAEELKKILKLRFDVFYQELLEKKSVISADIDEFDFICDHLAVFDKEKQKYVGTYRLNLSSFSHRFYSSQEFDIKNILALPDVKLELGRACVDKEYRTGVIIGLLWRGLAEYIRLSNTRFLFGCSSIKTMEKKDAGLLYLYLMKYHKAPDDMMVIPRKNFRIPSFTEYVSNLKLDSETTEIAKSLIPPLLGFYLKAGAYICGEPALDKAFKCIDFFTILDMNNLRKNLEKKYNV